jgi:hypothetical protein
MSRTAPAVVAVQPLERHHLKLRFADGCEGVVDLFALTELDGVLAGLRDPQAFRQVRVEFGTAVWPDDIDLAPETLYWAATGAAPVGMSIDAALTRILGSHRAPESAPPPAGPVVTAPEEPAPGTEHAVPEICRFLGIIVRMFFADHEVPHFHAYYAGQSARFDLETLQVLDGDLPARVRGLVVEWASLHRDELRDDWERARRHEPLRRIEPLV